MRSDGEHGRKVKKRVSVVGINAEELRRNVQ